MRKRCKRQTRPLSPPMLINRGLRNDVLERRERMLVQAFAFGWADKEHFDSLCDMRNCLTIAAAYKGDQGVLAICDAMRIVMGNVRDRHAQTGRMGVTGDELQLLQEFVGIYRDFWLRQPVALYETAVAEVQRLLNAKGQAGPKAIACTDELGTWG